MVDRFPFGNDNMAKIYEDSLSTIMLHGKNRVSRDPPQSAKFSLWVVHRAL